MSQLILLDDGGGAFGPLTDLRPTYELRTGACTTEQRIARCCGLKVAGRIVPSTLEAIEREKHSEPVNTLPPDGEDVLIVNGRLTTIPSEPPPLGTIEIDPADGSLRRAHLDAGQAEVWLRTGATPDRVNVTEVSEPAMLRHPWDLLAGVSDRIVEDIEHASAGQAGSIPPSATVIGDATVIVADDALLDPGTILDARKGPIMIGPGASIGAHSVLAGPCAIGPGCMLGPHTQIKAGTATGPRCRLGGEIGGTIFQGHANKSHHGHLGDSWVGEWANLGAGTVNSNLLNTYGEVPMKLEPDGPTLRSGRTFLGCLIGDHVKTAIGTRIMTGTVLGTGAMIACSQPPPSCTPRFAWLSDKGNRQYQIGKFLKVMDTVMARRDRTPGDAYVARVSELHESRT